MGLPKEHTWVLRRYRETSRLQDPPLGRGPYVELGLVLEAAPPKLLLVLTGWKGQGRPTALPSPLSSAGGPLRKDPNCLLLGGGGRGREEMLALCKCEKMRRAPPIRAERGRQG